MPRPPQRYLLPVTLVGMLLGMLSIGGCAATGKPATGTMAQSSQQIDADAPTEFTTTASGLKYRILRRGTDQYAKASDSVQVHYAGWLDNGKEFDSSYKRGEPTSFPLRNVVPGWTEGLQLVGKGGMIELEIPPQLGYGPRGMPGAIPPNATLHFRVELLEIL